MQGLSTKQLVRKGMFYLGEAVLDVLLEAKHEEECLYPIEIGRRADLSYSLYEDTAIVYGVLKKLEDEGCVERCPDHNKKWQLTAKEFEKRHEDL